MSMPKGTQPKPRQWVQCHIGDLRTAITRMRDAKITITHERIFNQDVYADSSGVVLARIYHHKRSEQCMVHVSVRKFLPERLDIVMPEASIYGA